MKRNSIIVLGGLFLAMSLTACEPEVGSEEWCKEIEERGVENITASEATDYARECIL